MVIHKYEFMRTTIDIPDQLFKKMKTRAIEEEVTMKDYLLKIIHRELGENTVTLNSKKVETIKLKTRKKKKVYRNSEINKLRDELFI
jgi:hypothetical protein